MKKALVFDDQDIRHEKIAKQLGNRFEVHHARSVDEALTAMKAQRFDLISLDHDMGESPSGHERANGSHLVRSMIAEVPEDHRPAVTRIHSWHGSKAIEMLNDLRGAGFPNVYYEPFQP